MNGWCAHGARNVAPYGKTVRRVCLPLIFMANKIHIFYICDITSDLWRWHASAPATARITMSVRACLRLSVRACMRVCVYILRTRYGFAASPHLLGNRCFCAAAEHGLHVFRPVSRICEWVHTCVSGVFLSARCLGNSRRT